MPTTLDNIKASTLPKAWRQKAAVTDSDYVSVTITPITKSAGTTEDKAKQRHTLLGIMDELAQEAQQNGMTEQDLADIIDDRATRLEQVKQLAINFSRQLGKKPITSTDHGSILYDEFGLPK